MAASKAFGHSSCGRWPHPDIATSLCMRIGKRSMRKDSSWCRKSCKIVSRKMKFGRMLTEFTNFEAIAWEDLKETRESSVHATTNTGMSCMDWSKDSAFLVESIVSDDNFPISWSASSHPSTYNGAWKHYRTIEFN